MSERPAKRARGSYAKLICLRCRERRIKCQLDNPVEPSPSPQPQHLACQRCKQQDLECIVRKTTLGRPSQKTQTLPTPASTSTHAAELSRSPSPETEDFVLLQLDNNESTHNKSLPAIGLRPTNLQLVSRQDGHRSFDLGASVLQVFETSADRLKKIAAIGKNFDLTSGLLARDTRFGSAIMECRDLKPPSLDKVIDRELADVLDQHLVWQRLYVPWLPRLTVLYDEIIRPQPDGGVSTILLAALMSSIALDTPSKRITTEQRKLQDDLRSIVYHVGQSVLFTLPKHVNTVTALILVHGYRPMALNTSQQAASHSLSGKLYPTLIGAIQRQLGFSSAASRLRAHFAGSYADNPANLIDEAIHWASTLSLRSSQELDEIERDHHAFGETEQEMTTGFEIVAEAIERNLAKSGSIFSFHVVRYHADYVLAIRNLTAHWNDLEKLSSIIKDYDDLYAARKQSFERDLKRFFFDQGKTDEALALSQLSNLELHQGRTNVLGIAMFFAIISGAQKSDLTNQDQTMQLNKYYTDALGREADLSPEQKSDVRNFLDRYGDAHMDGLERRLTDFINAATEVHLHGIPFVGPARHTASNVLIACKEIVENNAARIKLDGELHHRADMQLILFQEAARRLEGMEADGGTAEAIAKGSVFTAAAKLIRSLHRIVSQWKRNEMSKQQGISQSAGQLAPHSTVPLVFHDAAIPTFSDCFESDGGLFTDDFLGNWENWPQLDATDMSHLFNTFDFDPSSL